MMSLPQRHCWILQGDFDWLNQQAQNFYQSVPSSTRFWVSDHIAPDEAIPVKKAHQHLGQECDLLIFQVTTEFDADAFGALIGCVKAGGTVLVLLNTALQPTHWLKRFLNIATAFPAIQSFNQQQSLPDLVLPGTENSLSPVIPTEEQSKAIASVMKVVSGHRRRPLVLTADRGRGKSALLGMAAAELLKSGKQHILVTAPSPANIQTLLLHAHQQLAESKLGKTSVQWHDAIVEFMAPDAILQSQPATDLLIVDEAAAIPANMLEQYLLNYSRLVFSSTIHGYEGTGRGFALRFYKTLDRLAPGWRACALERPVRWAENDIVEQFSFAALLLDAEPVDGEVISAAEQNELIFETLEQQQLLSNERLLRQVFGLMALAHYRTRPADLQMLLDHPDMRVSVLRYQGNVVATLWTIDEPALDSELAQQVYDGIRRLKGHLLPQSLLVHAGIEDAAQYHYQRISRIAVHPDCQQRGWGQLLLQQYFSTTGNADVVGVSFALSVELLNFWSKAGFKIVRIGHHSDEVSGSLSVMMLKAINADGEKLVKRAQQTLAQQWFFLLGRQWHELDATVVIHISQSLNYDESSKIDYQQQVRSFAYQQRPFESSEWALWQWLRFSVISQSFEQLTEVQQHLLIMLVLQGRRWDTVAKELNLTGRKQILAELRQAIKQILTSETH
ncbi:tRNA(Met)-cytidine N(4)-acetyltransferase [Methylophaga sulfidovorans]|uniref:tRNA(Met) cytidine acetyltransferase TmcA n=2 Tax=Methylophaga sulfidovorans TaxID=45496 RepID=A0A1I3XFU7_9GAMM|nr:tRNA(Met)-cytidine N(4)-acetyltransferase [Methylophaga sulfidovorans]